MNKSEKSKGLTPSFRYIPKGVLTSNKNKKIPFRAHYSNGFFAYSRGYENDL